MKLALAGFKTNVIRPLLLAVLALGLGVKALAAEELLVRKALTVYGEANSNSEVLTTLEAGERVPIATQEYGRFRKVLIEKGGKKKAGFVRQVDLQGNRIREKKGSTRSDQSKKYHHRLSFVLPVTFSYSSQPAQNITSEGYQYEMSQLSGTTVYFGLGADIPIDDQWLLRAELQFRKAEHTGTIRPTTGNAKEVQRTITFLGFGGYAKYYFSADGDFFAGAGLEVAKANSVNLIYANTDKVPVSEADYPTYMIAKGGVGGDFNLFSNFYLIPEVRLMSAVNTTPAVYGGEIVLGLAYSL